MSFVLPVDFDDLDRAEGYPVYYDRQHMPAGSVTLENGSSPSDVVVYVAHGEYAPLEDADGGHISIYELQDPEADQERARAAVKAAQTLAA